MKDETLSGYESSVLAWLERFPTVDPAQREDLLKGLGAEAQELAQEIIRDQPSAPRVGATRKVRRAS